MNMKLINRGEEAELILEGRLDTYSAPEAEPIFQDAAARFERIVLNMKGLEYVSSSGLRIIKNLHIAMRKRGGTLVLTNVTKMVMEVFEMTGFSGLLQFGD